MSSQTRYRIAVGSSIICLIVMIILIYGRFYVAPYVGFSYSPANGMVMAVHDNSPTASMLKSGDIILETGGQRWAEIIADPRRTFFQAITPGQTLEMIVERAGEPIQVTWIMPTEWKSELWARLVNVWLLGPVFWLFGLLTIVHLRPRDDRWLLLSIFFSQVAVWLLSGSNSPFRIWGVGVVMRMVSWYTMGLGLHLHWLFPHSLGHLSRSVVVGWYTACAALASLELVGVLPAWAFYGAVLVAFIGATGLLIAQGVKHPGARVEVSFLALVLGSILLINITMPFVVSKLGLYHDINIGVLILGLIPAVYFYLVYRHQPEGLQFLANQALVFIAFGLLFVLIALAVLGIGILLGLHGPSMMFWTVVMMITMGLAAAAFFPGYQRWFERIVLKVPMQRRKLISTYALRIATSPDRERIISILRDEVMPSYMIREAALLRIEGADIPNGPTRIVPICMMGVSSEQIPDHEHVREILRVCRERPYVDDGWVKVAMPLDYRGYPIGLCLMGRRDPDNEYFKYDLIAFQTLLSQTAMALVNTEQAELIHNLQRQNITRREEERRRLARDLHDDVLGQLAALALSLEQPGDARQEAYQSAVQRTRDIIAGLRPAALEQFGLYIALEELMDDLAVQIDQRGGGPDLCLDVEPSEVRYPKDVELGVFRIVQQACKNTLDHANAANLNIHGELAEGNINLGIVDDGCGFDAAPSQELIPLLVREHYGLLMMQERAALAGGKVIVSSKRGVGTQIEISWPGVGPASP